MNTATHTPTPWIAQGNYITARVGASQRPICEMSVSAAIGGDRGTYCINKHRPTLEANRDLIARAVNAHDVLVAALRKIIDRAPAQEPEAEDYHDTESAFGNGLECAAWDLAQIARAALAKAGA